MIEQITWLIWRALHTPPTKLGQQLHEMRELPESALSRFQFKRIYGVAIAIVILLALGAIWWIASVDWLTIVITSGLVVLGGSLIGLILASGTIHGIRWAFQVATVVYHDIHEGHYDLMSLTPLGVLGALWMMTHEQSRLNRVVAFFQTVSLAVFLALLLVGVAFLVTLVQGPPTVLLSQPILGSIFGIGLVVLLFYLDYVQAVVIGHLSGIYLASIASSLLMAEVLAMVVVFAIQAATYLLAGLVGFLGAIMATYIFARTGNATLLLISLAFVGTAYTFREVAIRVLWRTILVRFAVTNIEFKEFQQAVT